MRNFFVVAGATTVLLLLVVAFAATSVCASRLSEGDNIASSNPRKKATLLQQRRLQLRSMLNASSSSTKKSAAAVGDENKHPLEGQGLPFVRDLSSVNVLESDKLKYNFGASPYKILDVPPRYMWGWQTGVSGYCGETCFQSALLLFGAYVSSERVRYADGNAELLIGVNDEAAAKSLILNYATYSGGRATGQDFLDDFVAPKINSGYPVVLGWYEKVKSGGDSDYDHIMIIIGYDYDASKGTVTGVYFNDMWSTATRYISKTNNDGSANAYFIATRSTCKQSSAPVQPYDYCIPSAMQYAIALQGLKTTLNGISTRVSVTGGMTYKGIVGWTEPDWGAEDGKHETPVQQTYTFDISGLTTGASYKVLRFDSASAVTSTPSKGSYSWSSAVFTATGSTMTLSNADQTMSDGINYWVTIAA